MTVEFTGVAQETTVVFLGLAGRAAILKADVDQAYIAVSTVSPLSMPKRLKITLIGL